MDQKGQGHPKGERTYDFPSPIVVRSNLVFQTDSIVDTSREQLQIIQKTRSHPDPKVMSDLRKRKLITMQKVISFKIEKGPKFSTEFTKEETDLTAEMLAR